MLEILEREVEQLTKEELGQFRDWFLAFEWEAWDRQIEADAVAGKLDALTEEALAEYHAYRFLKVFSSSGLEAMLEYDQIIG